MKLFAIVENTPDDIHVLLCVRGKRLTKIEIERRLDELYPPYLVTIKNSFSRGVNKEREYVIRRRMFDVPKLIADAVAKGFLEIEKRKSERNEPPVFQITKLGRGLITSKKKKK